MEKRIIFATGNQNKMKEIHMILADLGMPIYSMKEAGIDIDIVEDGTTFEETHRLRQRQSQSTCRMILFWQMIPGLRLII